MNDLPAIKVRFYESSDQGRWDAFVLNHPASTHCHLSGWKEVIERTYGHKGYYLLAEEEGNIQGILPLFHLKSHWWGNQLVSMPFLSYGGILSDSPEGVRALTRAAVDLGSSLKASGIELRHLNSVDLGNEYPVVHRTQKVRMLLDLPNSKEELLPSFKSKLRSQIARPRKEGMNVLMGDVELLNGFYEVFSHHMRDLGSPVHSPILFREILREFSTTAKIALVNYQGKNVAAGLILAFRNTVEIPWASSLHKYNRLSPNMLLYWTLIEYSCDRHFRYFDFGRSTPSEGTYRFKEQWGAKPLPLQWQSITLKGKASTRDQVFEKSRYDHLIRLWKKMPLPLSRKLGPLVRKNISL